jgi:homoserine acetyltransferase
MVALLRADIVSNRTLVSRLKHPLPQPLKTQDLTMGNDYESYQLGNFKLKSGGEIPDAFIAYKTLGDPSLPAVIYPTWYSGG